MKAKAREKGLHTIDLLHRRSTKAGHCNRCRISITFANRRKQTAVFKLPLYVHFFLKTNLHFLELLNLISQFVLR